MRIMLLLTIFISSHSQAVCDANSSCNYTKKWSDFTKLVVVYSETKDGDKTEFEYLQTENELVVNVSSKKGVATLFSINGVGTLYKNIGNTGIKTSQECWPDIGDTYTILAGHAHRTLYFIGIGSNTTPETIDKMQKIYYEHKKGSSRIQINPGDYINIESPWYLSGSLKNEETITYNIHHKRTVKGELEDLFISGLWSDKPINNGITDNTSLDDWLVCIGGKTSYENKELIFEPYITDTEHLKTVGQLRDSTRASSSELEASKQ